VDDDTADALALAENFIREPMHPLDEAEAFAKLARQEAKGVESIATEFGLCPTSHETGEVGRASEGRVPPGRDRHRDRRGVRVRSSGSAIGRLAGSRRQPAACAARPQCDRPCVDRRQKSATFDVSKLPQSAVSKDSFAERVLIERKVFLEAHAEG
jgi:hypothetical protein